MRGAAIFLVVDGQKLAAPDGAVAAVAGAVPGDAKHRTLEPVVRHARKDVRQMMRHARHRQTGIRRGMAAVIFRMRIAGDDTWLDPMQRRQFLCHARETVARAPISEIADMWAGENLPASPAGA